MTKASQAILVGESLQETFRKVLDLVFEYLPAQRGFIMLWDEERKDFAPQCIKHKDLAQPTAAPIRFSRTIAEKVYRDKVAVITTDAQTDGRFASGASIMELGIRSAIAAPLWNGDAVDGLIYADTTVLAKAFDSFDLDLLSALGNHVAVAIGQSRLQASVLEQQLARRRLERYHSPAVVEAITEARDGTEGLVAEERDVTVVFADLVGFTPRCEKMEPREVGQLLNRYFSEMTQVIFDHDGMGPAAPLNPVRPVNPAIRACCPRAGLRWRRAWAIRPHAARRSRARAQRFRFGVPPPRSSAED